MRTPAQALHDAIASGAVDAWHRGEKICLSHAESLHWNVWSFSDKELPQFINPEFIWRPAPAKRRIPFTQATVPKNALWRYKVLPSLWFAPVKYFADGIGFANQHAHYDSHLLNCEYSTDGGVTWQPGSQEVES